MVSMVNVGNTTADYRRSRNLTKLAKRIDATKALLAKGNDDPKVMATWTERLLQQQSQHKRLSALVPIAGGPMTVDD